ncbi:MAG: hypothetical protein A2V91_01775 [Candidatus Muproteobacteria bacterium RBG_16_64_10]|uniref:Uncharacterized protein n=1 Tax=Candidatus Muproteobacteria bacterium RBG_16_64_10 TaxID=1817757 RepID=A0A1F6T5R9_9PROT|nr:MAG: hypothetical protein A2V91_01775 [Candidatus Muproteobacteria bacterium RBG_16_64_10]
MKFKDVLKSPVFPRGHRWSFEKRKGVYESEVTALVRKMLEDESIREDQRFAAERWRAEERLTKKP